MNNMMLNIHETTTLIQRMSELEQSVAADMLDNGFDPFDDLQVQEYWKEKLDDI